MKITVTNASLTFIEATELQPVFEKTTHFNLVNGENPQTTNGSWIVINTNDVNNAGLTLAGKYIVLTATIDTPVASDFALTPFSGDNAIKSAMRINAIGSSAHATVVKKYYCETEPSSYSISQTYNNVWDYANNGITFNVKIYDAEPVGW